MRIESRKNSKKQTSTILQINDRKPTAIDLFCGCGGLTVGLKKAGFRVLGAVDNDALAMATYTANHSGVYPFNQDISSLTTLKVKRRLKIKKGKLDLLAGCPPCQGFSTIRTLNGAKSVFDPRNDLIHHFFRFVKEFRPKAVMLENVPGLAKDERFATFCSEMKRLEYEGDYKILNIADFGVPQRRKRLIYLAGYKKQIPFANISKRQKTVRETIESLPPAGKSGDPVHDIPENRSIKVMDIIRRIPKNGGSRTDLPEEDQLDCHKRCDGFKDVYGRMAWDEVAPTITSGCFNPSKGRFLHPEEDRAITMREASLLQGFPRKYKFPTTDNKSAIALMIGNALPPPFIKAHARQIAGVILKSRE